jgi:type IV pilus assembly protein PilF
MSRIKFFIWSTAVLLTACATSTPQQKNEAELHLQIGSGFLSHGNYPAALRELQTAESLDPNSEVIENNLGLVYFVRQRNELAEQHLRQALKIKPNYTEALNNLARVHIEEGYYDEAIVELGRVLNDLTYDSAEKAWVNLGMAYFRKGQFDQAKLKLAEAIRLNRQNCLAHTLYGRSLLELRETLRAAEELDVAIGTCQASRYDEPHYFSGIAYYKLGNTDKAIARMEEVIKLYPSGDYAPKAQSMLKQMRR